jgi:hypothetical protein
LRARGGGAGGDDGGAGRGGGIQTGGFAARFKFLIAAAMLGNGDSFALVHWRDSSC